MTTVRAPLAWLVAALTVLLLAPARPADAAPERYAAQTAAIVQDGRAVVALVAAGDAAALHQRFAPPLARDVPLADLDGLLARTVRTAPLGAALGESTRPLGPQERVYAADHRWRGGVLGIELVLDAGDRIASLRLVPREPLGRDPNAGRRIALSLPFRGTWWVYWGGPTERQNYHATTPAQRHAFDLLVWRHGSTHRGDGSRNDQYHAWERPVLAPADAVVIAAVDGLRDNRPLVQTDTRRPAGNHVVLDLGGSRYAFLAHLRRGSVRVREGDRVGAGDVLGRVGNSGNSSEPHLHVHVQDRAALAAPTAHGIAIAFSDYRTNGRHVNRGTPVQGQFLRPR